ncbi:MAG: hypothetical protein RLZZ573_2235, partial [Pseudomonadota bacterium]
MPLPSAPTKRADQLPAKAFEAGARSTARAPRKPEPLTVEAPVHSTPPSAAVAAKPKDAAPRKSVRAPALLREPERAAPAKQTETRTTPPALAVPAVGSKKSARQAAGPSKLFVLDTNVLMHDPMCLFRFEEHDIYLPMIVLEELDGHKKGMTEVARNARQTSRTLDALAGTPGADITAGFQLA